MGTSLQKLVEKWSLTGGGRLQEVVAQRGSTVLKN